MLLHLLKLISSRKTASLLIIAEVAVTFMVLFGLFAISHYYYQLYQYPLGYQWHNNWTINISYDATSEQEKLIKLRRIIKVLEAHAKITTVGLSRSAILGTSYWNSYTSINDKRIDFNLLEISTHLPQQWGVELISGKWFYPQSAALDYRPIMVNQKMVEQLTSSQNQPFNPVGAIVPYNKTDTDTKHPRKIIGVFKDLRQHGELAKPVPLILYPYDLNTAKWALKRIHITYALPPTITQQAELKRSLLDIAPKWTFSQQSWADLRQNLLAEAIVPLLIAATIIGFLLIMVAMGLFAVLWQNIARRSKEIGLRRALGASKADIIQQIIYELILTSVIAISIATLVLLPLPLFNIIEQVNWHNFWFSLLSAAITILLTVFVSALYPSRLASKTPPAKALYED